jgi:hypothetical protein
MRHFRVDFPRRRYFVWKFVCCAEGILKIIWKTWVLWVTRSCLGCASRFKSVAWLRLPRDALQECRTSFSSEHVMRPSHCSLPNTLAGLFILADSLLQPWVRSDCPS